MVSIVSQFANVYYVMNMLTFYENFNESSFYVKQQAIWYCNAANLSYCFDHISTFIFTVYILKLMQSQLPCQIQLNATSC